MVRSVLLITSLLELLAEKKELGVTELSEHLNINKSTVYRFLTSLKELNYVQQKPDNEKYCLSLRILDLAGHILAGLDVRTAAQPVMERLSHQTRETIHLAKLDQDEIIYIDKIDSTQPLRMHSYIGQKVPSYASSLGKVLLAWSTEETLKRFFDRGNLYRITDKTITDPSLLMEELHKIKVKGYAVDIEENVPGVCCVGAPIWEIEGMVAAAISISMPSIRFKEDQLPYYGKLIIEGALEISKNLGYTGSRKQAT